jgi:hypothetical protein
VGRSEHADVDGVFKSIRKSVEEMRDSIRQARKAENSRIEERLTA